MIRAFWGQRCIQLEVGQLLRAMSCMQNDSGRFMCNLIQRPLNLAFFGHRVVPSARISKSSATISSILEKSVGERRGSTASLLLLGLYHYEHRMTIPNKYSLDMGQTPSPVWIHIAFINDKRVRRWRQRSEIGYKPYFRPGQWLPYGSSWPVINRKILAHHQHKYHIFDHILYR